MEPMAIALKIQEQFPGQVLEMVEHRGQVGVVLRRDRISEVCRLLHDGDEFRMHHLMALCGVDYTGMQQPYFEVVYNLYSIQLRHALRLRARVPSSDLRIDSVTSIWPGANWLERETFDLLGIAFQGHPDLRRILLPDTWEGHPLRKGYPLQLPKDKEWAGYEELKQTARELRRFDFIPTAGRVLHRGPEQETGEARHGDE